MATAAPTPTSADLEARRAETRARLEAARTDLGAAIADGQLTRQRPLAAKVAELQAELDGYELAVGVATDRERAAADEAARLGRIGTATGYYRRFADLLERLVPLAERQRDLEAERERIMQSDELFAVMAGAAETEQLGLLHGPLRWFPMYVATADVEDLRTTAQQAREYAAGIEARGG